MTPLTWRRAAFVAGLIAIAAVLALIAMRIPRTLSIFIIAAFVASAVQPIVHRLEARMARALAIAAVYAALVLVVIVLAVLVVPATVAQLQAILVNAPDYVVASQNVVRDAEHGWTARLGNRIPWPSGMDMQTEIGVRVAAMLSTLIASIGTVLVSLATGLLIIVSALILSCFFVIRRDSVRASILSFVPPSKRVRAGALMTEIATIFGGFVGGQALLSTLVGVSVTLVLALLGDRFALLIGVICGIAYAIPFFGMIVAQVIAAALAFSQGAWHVAWITIAIFVIARFADYVLVPKIMSESVGVSPIAVMFAVFAGGELFGIPGLLLGIPGAALVKLLFKYFVTPYMIRLQTEKAEPEPVEVQVDVDAPVAASVVVGVR